MVRELDLRLQARAAAQTAMLDLAFAAQTSETTDPSPEGLDPTYRLYEDVTRT